jgi:heme/copper-type cytochrome/quinol oxidase subunit 2
MITGEMIIAVICSGTIATLMSGVVQIILWKLNRKAKKQDDETEYEKHMRNALCVFLYDRVKYLCRHHIGAKYITVEDLEDLSRMHKSYQQDLNGNGFLDGLMEQVKALEIRK